MTAVLVGVSAVAAATALAAWLGHRGGRPRVALLAGIGALCATGLIAVPVVVSYLGAHHDERTAVCTVTGTDRDGGDEDSHRILTEQCGALANTDSLWRGKRNSADLWQEIEAGRTYTFRIVGWRAGYWSMVPNVLEVSP